jgi:hypothetical protein
VEAVDSLCDSAANRFVLKATVYPSKDSVGFVGYGDADPSNVSLLVRGAEMRIAETRAVNRPRSHTLRSEVSILGIASSKGPGMLWWGVDRDGETAERRPSQGSTL